MAIVLGVTGGIGSGKSTVLKMLADLGARTISADEIAHRILAKCNQAYDEVVKQFGESILGSDGEISRPALAAVVFKDPALRKKLEEITHPYIIGEIKNSIEQFRKDTTLPDSVLAVEIPLLFECNLDNIVDEVLLVAAEQEAQVNRLTSIRGVSDEDALRRIAAQMPLDYKVKRADRVIWNNGSLEELEESVKRVWTEILLP